MVRFLFGYCQPVVMYICFIQHLPDVLVRAALQ
jgi:hypothetical protein